MRPQRVGRVMMILAITGALAAAAWWRIQLPDRQLSDPDFMANAPPAAQVEAAERVLALPFGNHHDACIILGAHGDARSLPALIGALRWISDDGVCTSLHCTEALEQITGYEGADSHEAWQTWWRTTGAKLPLSAFPLPEPPRPPRPPLSGPSCSIDAIQAARRPLHDSACAALDNGAGEHHTCARRADGTLWCWGKAIPHQLGAGRAAPPTRVVDAGGEIVKLASAGDHTCTVDRAGTLQCWMFGSKTPPPPARVDGIADVALGRTMVCARAAGGALSCWSTRSDGKLGMGTTLRPGARKRRHPKIADLHPEVTDLGASAVVVSAAQGHACAARVDGSLWCWGSNVDSRRGGDEPSAVVPVPIDGLGTCVADVSAGERHTCARMVDASVQCWGRNREGQLGDGTRGEPRDAPAQVPGLSGVRQISLGDRHSCARKGDGSVWCWGQNEHGQLGDGSTTTRPSPVLVSGLGAGVVELSAGARHTCARKDDGSIWCWGHNDRGQLGDGTTVDRAAPVQALSCGE